MARHPEFTLQALEKIGAPLVAALEAVPLKTDDAELETAKRMAQMIGQVVQISIALSGQIAPPTESERDADALRASLAALAAPVIASYYEQHQKVPEEADINRMIKTLEAVLAFSDNFSSSADLAESRLITLDNKAPLFDKTQTALVTLHSLTPIIDAITEFSFGRSEGKLLQEISNKLNDYTKAIALKTSKEDNLSEMLIFKALVPIYASCHRAEIQRLADTDDENRGELSLDPIWKTFETKLSMVDVVLGVDIVSSDTQSTVAPTAVAETPSAVPPAQVEAAPATPAASGGPMGFFAGGGDNATEASAAPASTTQPPAAPPTATENTPPAEAPSASGGGGPMSFFSSGGDTPPAAPAAPVAPETPVAPPAAPTQPSVAEQPSVPAATPPAATPPADTPPAGGGGPMSFFKKPEGGEEGESST